MAALVVTTENRMRIIPYEAPHYKLIREAVGGRYELVHPKRLGEPYCMMVNEEGLLLDLPLNPLGCYLCGSCVIVGDIMILKTGDYNGEPDAIGMTDEEARRLGEWFVLLGGGTVRWADEKEREPTP